MKRKIVLFLAMALIAALLGGCGGKNAAFGYVDIQKVVQESAKVKELRTQVETKVKEMDEAAAKDKAALAGDELVKKQQATELAMKAFSNKIEEQFQTSLNTAIDEISKEKKLGAVLAKGSVLNGGVDITDEVIKRMK